MDGRHHTAAWRNGIASDYESGDCRFDPCGGHLVMFFFFHPELCAYDISGLQLHVIQLHLNGRNAIRFCRDIVMACYSRRKATYRWLL